MDTAFRPASFAWDVGVNMGSAKAKIKHPKAKSRANRISKFLSL
jgi:hypothetical protein